MRILGPNGSAAVATASAPRRATAGGFAVDTEPATTQTRPAAALRTIGGIDALIALQGQEDPAERRQRAVKRGRSALDALDELKAAMLAGSVSPASLASLRTAAIDLCDTSGDAQLDAVLAAIELRVQVEIAKLTPRS